MKTTHFCLLILILIGCKEKEHIEIKCLDRTDNVVFVVEDKDIIGVDWENQSFLIESKKADSFRSLEPYSLFALYYNSNLVYYINVLNPYNSNRYWKETLAPNLNFSKSTGILVDNWFIIQPFSGDSLLEDLVFNNEVYNYVVANKIMHKNWEISNKSVKNRVNEYFNEDFKKKFPYADLSFRLPNRSKLPN